MGYTFFFGKEGWSLEAEVSYPFDECLWHMKGVNEKVIALWYQCDVQ